VGPKVSLHILEKRKISCPYWDSDPTLHICSLLFLACKNFQKPTCKNGLPMFFFFLYGSAYDVHFLNCTPSIILHQFEVAHTQCKIGGFTVYARWTRLPLKSETTKTHVEYKNTITLYILIIKPTRCTNFSNLFLE